MPDELKDKSLDILGVKPVANSIEKVTDGVVDGAKAFLSRICLPFSEEFGLLLQDHVKSWRAERAARLAQKAEDKVKLHHGDTEVIVHPRIAHSVFDEGSWIDDDVVHSMWAGLLASSCSESGTDDSNIVFISTLKQLTAVQVRIIRYAVESADKYVSSAGWPFNDSVSCSIEKLKEVCETDDLLRIDRELDHLSDLGLLGHGMGGGFSPDSDTADITPSSLALHLYVRAEGFPGTPIEYWSLEKKPDPEPKPQPDPDANKQLDANA